MAACACIPTRAQIQAERARGAGDRQRDEYRSLPLLSSKQVRRALSAAKYLTQNKTVRPTAEYSCRKPDWRAKRNVLGDTPEHKRILGISPGVLQPVLPVRK